MLDGARGRGGSSARSPLTGAFSLALLVSAVAGIAVGRYLDRRSPRGLMTAGSIAATLLVVAWSQVEGLAAAVYAAAVGYSSLLWSLAGIAAVAAVLAYRAERRTSPRSVAR